MWVQEKIKDRFYNKYYNFIKFNNFKAVCTSFKLKMDHGPLQRFKIIIKSFFTVDLSFPLALV
jgi:hypothetical protein